jgi:DNA-binding NarL/FixJ family response regulator
MSIHVAIVEDERSMRENLAQFIDGTPGFACVAACASAEEALRRLPLVGPEVALVDINLPGKSGVDLVRPCIPKLLVILLSHRVLAVRMMSRSEESGSSRGRQVSSREGAGRCFLRAHIA